MSPTDKELLKLAAKAAGYDNCEYVTELECLVHDEGTFSPLTDDGDALRLAVKLGMFEDSYHCRMLESALYESDPYAATRRAIVRAAAEIGKQKE